MSELRLKEFFPFLIRIKAFIRRTNPKIYNFVCFIWKQNLRPRIWLIFNKPKGTLVYVGLNKGDAFGSLYYKFNKAIGYEANPELYKNLLRKFKGKKNIKLFNLAASDSDSEALFYISENENMVSSSLHKFNSEHQNNVGYKKSIKIKTVNLGNHLVSQNINFIDEYLSDAEGHDLTILKSIITFIENNKIKKLTCEVTRNDKKNPHFNSNNYEKYFDKLLPPQYKKISSGWGSLTIGEYDDVPDDYNFMDVVWINTLL